MIIPALSQQFKTAAYQMYGRDNEASTLCRIKKLYICDQLCENRQCTHLAVIRKTPDKSF